MRKSTESLTLPLATEPRYRCRFPDTSRGRIMRCGPGRQPSMLSQMNIEALICRLQDHALAEAPGNDVQSGGRRCNHAAGSHIARSALHPTACNGEQADGQDTRGMRARTQ